MEYGIFSRHDQNRSAQFTGRSMNRGKRQLHPARQLELLEPRRLLSVSFDPASGSLIVTGTQGPDTIVLTQSGNVLTVNLDGQLSNFNAQLVKQITVQGGAGNNQIMLAQQVVAPATLLGGGGTNTILAGGGPTSLQAGPNATNDTLVGGSGTDTIQGNAGHDSLMGGSGTAFIFAGTGDSKLVGGSGKNNVLVAGSTAGNDTLIGGTGGGDNLIYSGIGNALIMGGSGAQTITASQGNDTIYGGTGDQNILTSVGNCLVFGGTGNDSIQGGNGTDTIFGGMGNDTIQTGDGNNDYVHGGIGNDLIISGTSGQADGAGDVMLVGGMGNDTILAGFGNDTLVAGSGNNVMVGNVGNCTFIGGPGNNVMTGGDGNDTFVNAGGGHDTIDGGAGFNAAQVDPGDTFKNIDLFYGGQAIAPPKPVRPRLLPPPPPLAGKAARAAASTPSVYQQALALPIGTTPNVGIMNGLLVVRGTTGNDTITVGQKGSTLSVIVNGVNRGSYSTSLVPSGVFINSGPGTDNVAAVGAMGNVNSFVYIYAGGTGSDTLVGGAGYTFFNMGSGPGGRKVIAAFGTDTGIDFSGRTSACRVALDNSPSGQSGDNIQINVPGAAVIYGGRSVGNSMFGNANNDSIISDGYADTILGGSGMLQSLNNAYMTIAGTGIDSITTKTSHPSPAYVHRGTNPYTTVSSNPGDHIMTP